ncbi:MAG: NUDIX domain-containing protein [Erysipelotrichaceae bacterium]
MKYCIECGTKLIDKELANEGIIPYCTKCNEYRFPIYSAAISCVIMNKTKDKLLLIQQYNRKANILVAGYINKGESCEEALKREIKEEINCNVIDYEFNKTSYYEKSNTLMINFSVVIDEKDLKLNEEVDEAAWFTFEEAKKEIRPNSLAEHFLLNFLTKGM